MDFDRAKLWRIYSRALPLIPVSQIVSGILYLSRNGVVGLTVRLGNIAQKG